MVSLLFSKCLHSKGSFTRSDGNGNDIVASVHTWGEGRQRQHPNTYICKFAIAVATAKWVPNLFHDDIVAIAVAVPPM